MQFKGEGIYSGLQFKVTVHPDEEDVKRRVVGNIAATVRKMNRK